MDDNLIQKLRHIQELSERGVGGEKETAARMLKKLLEKHGLTMDSLREILNKADHKDRKEYTFNYKDILERQLLMQIYGKVTKVTSGTVTRLQVRNKKQVILELTESEYVQVKQEFKVYRKAFHEEVDLLLSAFIQKHRIFPPSDSRDDSEIDFDLLMCIWALTKTIKHVDVPMPRELQLEGSKLIE